MDKLVAIDRSLMKVRALLDEVARELAECEIPCRTADIEHIGEALAAISNIQLSIYEQRPDLTPDFLKERSEIHDQNRQFGRILIQNQHHLSCNKPDKAIDLLNAFLETKPPERYVEMANNEIKRIRKTFKYNK
jgi:hypothetical protein